MIRVVSLTSLTALLLLVLYLPSARSPHEFLQQLRAEHSANAAFWGEEVAQRILERMLDIQDQGQALSSVPAPAISPTSSDATSAPAREMARIHSRVFDNAYVRSIDALLVLACYRLATLLEWLTPSCVLALALILDALLVRNLKAKEFRHHDPELFAVYASLAIATLCATVLAITWPWRLHPAAWAGVPAFLALLIGRAIAHFHRRP